MAVVVNAFAKTHSAEVETKDGKAKGREGLHGVVDDFVVHAAAAGWVWMADDCGVRGIVAASVEESLKATGGTVKIVDRTYLGGSDLRPLLQFIGCARHPSFIGDAVCWWTWRLTLSHLLNGL